ncbi:hypothetical protein BU15DRAFT_62936 [Melanogaster broomeanus]|nr:hypothetical protein BU15DRAFT_62936 [Melanogaster broomeanus]
MYLNAKKQLEHHHRADGSITVRLCSAAASAVVDYFKIKFLQKMGFDDESLEELKHASVLSWFTSKIEEGIESFYEDYLSRNRAVDVDEFIESEGLDPEAYETFGGSLLKSLIDRAKVQMPIRVINTETGLVCDAEAVEEHFRGSPEYAYISAQEGLGRCEMQEIIQTYFGFAMLSHRWGQLEPTTKTSRSVRLDVTGVTGSENSPVFQSQLETAVHLRLSPFQLQGLYDLRGFSVKHHGYSGEFHHAVRTWGRGCEGKDVLGVRRKTTKPEDISYCLLGIFDVQMPVMYGEREKAFVRLQEAIMKKTTDPSLFHWVGKACSENTFLASSPYCFRAREAGTMAHLLQHTISIYSTEETEGLQRQRFQVDLYNALKALGPNASHPANYMAGSKLQIHGFLYQVKDVIETEESGAWEHEFLCEANQYYLSMESTDAMPTVVVTTPLRLRTGEQHLRLLPGSYSIFRPWSDHLGDSSVKVFDAQGDHPLTQPFVGQLLRCIPGGRYKRVHTTEPIIVHPPPLFFLSAWLHTKTIVVE